MEVFHPFLAPPPFLLINYLFIFEGAVSHPMPLRVSQAFSSPIAPWEGKYCYDGFQCDAQMNFTYEQRYFAILIWSKLFKIHNDLFSTSLFSAKRVAILFTTSWVFFPVSLLVYNKHSHGRLRWDPNANLFSGPLFRGNCARKRSGTGRTSHQTRLGQRYSCETKTERKMAEFYRCAVGPQLHRIFTRNSRRSESVKHTVTYQLSYTAFTSLDEISVSSYNYQIHSVEGQWNQGRPKAGQLSVQQNTWK